MFLEALTSKETASTGKVLQWNTDGYYKIGEDNWKDIEVEASFTYKGGSIGVIPRYLTPYTYMYFTIGQTIYETDAELGIEEEANLALLSFVLDDKEIELGKVELKSSLVIGQMYVIKVIITKNNYQVFVNNERYFNIDYNGITRGNACLYASKGNHCTSVSISSSFPNVWTSNVEAIIGSTVYNEEEVDGNKNICLVNPVSSLTNLYIEQSIDITDKDFTFYADYKGECTMAIRQLNGTSTGAEKLVEGLVSTTWRQVRGQYQVATNCTKIAIRFFVKPGKKTVINNVQVEPGILETTYIENSSLDSSAIRGASLLTFPTKDSIQPGDGTISMWINPRTDYDKSPTTRYMLFQYGDPINGINICGIGNQLSIQHGGTSLTVNNALVGKDGWRNIILTWDAFFVRLYIDGVEHKTKAIDLFRQEAEKINVGFDSFGAYNNFNGLIDDLIIYKTAIEAHEVEEIVEAAEPVEDSGEMTFRATFNHAIGNFNEAYIEIPNAPEYGSPILAQKESGEPLRKVSFLDYDTGEYVTWNKQDVAYYGEDYVQVHFNDLDTTSFKVNVTDSKGNNVGEPYNVVGKRVYMTLTEEEKAIYKGRTLTVLYQLDDSYTVDFNTAAADSFRVNIAKHDGQKVNVIYEGNRFSQEKLAEMIEMNPMLNPNHQGFLYVTETNEPIVSFIVKLTPSDLTADGISESLIIVEPVDGNGNHVCEAKLTVSAEHGMVYPHLEMESVRLRQIAGRYIYRYVAPRKTSSVKGEVQNLIDSIKIIDEATGVGVEKYMTLCLYDDYEMALPEIADKHAISSELMAAFLLDKLIEHIGEKTSELPEQLRILNFTKSGVINIKDVTWIKEKLHTAELQEAYQAVLSYTQRG